MVYAYTDEESGLHKGHVAGPRPTGACGDWKNRFVESHDGRLGEQVKLGVVVDNVHSYTGEIVCRYDEKGKVESKKTRN